jgi:predicted alpha/beta hydrolase
MNLKVKSGEYELDVLIIEPSISPKGVIQFNSATATPKEFYIPFAEFLSANGYIVCLYDYRGICKSTPKDGLSKHKIHYLDWVTDMDSIAYMLIEKYPNIPKIFFGHSVGGQKIGFMKSISSFKGLVTVATSVGYLQFMPLGYRLKSYFFFFIFARISHLIYGYNAAKLVGIMENLPTGVTEDWRRWCSVPDYFFNEKEYGKTVPIGHYKNFPFPVKIYYAADDPISNDRSIPQFWNHVKSEFPITIQKLIPSEFKTKEIGHFGFFRRKFEKVLWPLALNDVNDLFNK